MNLNNRCSGPVWLISTASQFCPQPPPTGHGINKSLWSGVATTSQQQQPLSSLVLFMGGNNNCKYTVCSAYWDHLLLSLNRQEILQIKEKQTNNVSWTVIFLRPKLKVSVFYFYSKSNSYLENKSSYMHADPQN